MPATPPVRNAMRAFLTAFARRGRHPDVAAHGQRHAGEAGQRREQRADQEEGAAPPADSRGVRGQHEQYPEDREDEDAQRPELPSQVRRGALLHRGGYLLHLRGPLAGGQDLAHQHARDREGRQGDDRDDHNPGEVAAADSDRVPRSTRREGGVELGHSISLDVWRAPLRQSFGELQLIPGCSGSPESRRGRESTPLAADLEEKRVSNIFVIK